MALCSFIAASISILTLQRPLLEHIKPKPAIRSAAHKPKTNIPRIYNLGGHPALSAAHLNLRRMTLYRCT
jgi:hypothetical protein